ncbi:general secretion pathway protein GspB [Chitinimonas naiadis]
MSYILDALQKAEQERQRGAVPTLQTPVSSQPERPVPAYWAYGLLAAVLLAAGVLIGWWQPWRPAAAASQAVTPAIPQTVVAATPPAPAAQAVPAAQTAEPVMPPVAAVAPPAAPPVALPLPAPAQSPQGSPVASPKAAEPKPVPPSREPAVSASEETMALESLPPAIRQGIPAMTVLVHSYSSQRKDRMVIVNNKPLHEGDSLVAGLRLEEITSEGMIYSYKGYRFKAGVR